MLPKIILFSFIIVLIGVSPAEGTGICVVSDSKKSYETDIKSISKQIQKLKTKRKLKKNKLLAAEGSENDLQIQKLQKQIGKLNNKINLLIDARTRCKDLPGTSPIIVRAAASVTNGIGPLGVFFNAIVTTAEATNEPFSELEYEWYFGDPSSGIWPTSGRDKNIARGALAFHVFTQPGTYTVRLTVRDGENRAKDRKFIITVSNPESVFTGANTICFANSGGFAGCPSGARQILTGSFNGALRNYLGTNKRLLFKRGDNFTASATTIITASGPGMISSFGAGDKPVIQSTGNVTPLTVEWQSLVQDWRITGLSFQGRYPSGATTGNGIEPGSQFLIMDNIFNGFETGVMMAGFPRHRVALIENIFQNNKFYQSYISGGPGEAPIPSEIAITGNIFENPANTQTKSSLRTYIGESIIAENIFREIGGPGHHLKLCGTKAPFPAEYLIIAGNKFNDPGQAHSWVVSIGPENDDASSRQVVNQVIVERNLWNPRRDDATAIQSRGAGNVTVRNNIFYETHEAIQFSKPVPNFSSWHRWSILNNSMIFHGTEYAAFFSGYEQAKDLTIRNNIISLPNVTDSSGVTLLHTPATSREEVSESNNLWYTPGLSPSFPLFDVENLHYSLQQWTTQFCTYAGRCGESTVTLNPRFAHPSAENLSVQSNSSALNSGMPTPKVLSDYVYAPRSWTDPDRGAFEQ